MSGSQGGDDVLYEVGRSLEGIYEITEHMWNFDACETGGAYVSGHTHLALYTLGTAALAEVNVISCEGVEACRASVEAATSGQQYLSNFHFTLDTAQSETTLVGVETHSVREGEICYRKLTDAVIQRIGNDGVRIHAKFWHGEQYAPDDQGSCNTETGDVPTMDGACDELEWLHAVRVASDLEF